MIKKKKKKTYTHHKFWNQMVFKTFSSFLSLFNTVERSSARFRNYTGLSHLLTAKIWAISIARKNKKQHKV